MQWTVDARFAPQMSTIDVEGEPSVICALGGDFAQPGPAPEEMMRRFDPFDETGGGPTM